PPRGRSPVSVAADLVGFLVRAQRALDSEVAAVAKAAGAVALEGTRLRATAHGVRYRFRLADDVVQLQEGPVLVECGAATGGGTVDRVEGTTALVTTVKDLGARPGRTELRADVVHLIEALRDVLRGYENGAAPFEETRVREAMGFVQPREARSPRVCVPADL